MTYFAQLENGLVLQVRVVQKSFMAKNPDRYSGAWVEVFLNGDDARLRASPGDTYNSETGYFIPPQPFPSWVLDEATCLWVAPIAYPAEGDHVWDEQAGDWVEVQDEAE